MGFLSFIVAAELVLGLIIADTQPLRAVDYHSLFLAQTDAVIAPDAGIEGQPSAGEASPEQTVPAELQTPSSEEQIQTSPEEQLPAETAPGENQAQENSVPPEENQPQPETVSNMEEASVAEISNVVSADEETAASKTETFSSEEIKELNEAGLFENPENVAEPVTEKAVAEDEQLAQIITPAEETESLINFAGQKDEEISALTEAGDFTTTDFVVQRINDQLDQALNNIGSLSAEDAAPLKEAIAALADKAEPVFRAEQLVVPEDLEQDLEITRGKFLNIQEIK